MRMRTDQTLWHLGFLLEFNYISETKYGKIKAYSDLVHQANEVLAGFLILKRTLRELLACMKNFPYGIEIKELEKEMAKSRSTLYYTLNKLKERDVILKSKDSSTSFKINLQFLPLIEESIKKFESIFK